MLRHSIVLVALLAFPACSAIDAATQPISAAAPAEFNKAKQALTSAHILHKTTADFLVIAAGSNLCHGPCAVEAKKLLDQSETILTTADAAVATGDAASIEAKISAASALLGKIQSMMGKN